MSGRRALRLSVALVVVGATLAYIVAHLQRQWQALAEHDWSLDPWLLLGSMVLLTSWFLLRPRLWQLLVRDFGGRLSYRQAFRIWALSELGRYVPGKAVYVVARPALAAQAGVRPSVAVASMVVELAIVMVTSSLLFLMPFWVSPALRARYGLLAAALLLPLLVLVHPRSFSWLLNRGLRLLKREPLAVRLTWGQLARLLGLSALMWVGMGAAFAMFARSLWPAVAWSDACILAGAYALAWTLGLASVVSPGGLGVREAVLLALLGGPLAPAGAVVVAIGSRVWVTLAELAFAGVALLLPRRTE